MNHTLLNNQERARQLRIRVENITILLLAVFSFFLFLLTFFPFSRISKAMQGSFEMGRMVQRAFSIVLFVLSLQLWKRKRNAWTIADGDLCHSIFCADSSEWDIRCTTGS